MNTIQKILISLYLKFDKWIIQPVIGHFMLCYRVSDPIKFLKSDEKETDFRKHFYFVLCHILFGELYGTVGLNYQSTGSWKIANWSSNPYVSTHQIAPQSAWSQADCILALNAMFGSAIYLAFIFTREIPDKRRFTKTNVGNYQFGTKEITIEECAQIRALDTKAKLYLHLYPIALYLFIYGYMMINVLLNNVNIVSVLSLVFWTIGYPLSIWYRLNALYYTFVLIILSSRYLCILQQTVLQKLKSLNRKLKSNKRELQLTMQTRLHRFLHTNTDIVRICSAIEEYSRYCTPILSVLFPFYIILQCYFINVIHFGKLSTFEKQFLFCLVLTTNVNLFVVTRECARVVKYNRRIELQCAKFCFNFNATDGVWQVKRGNLVELSALQEYKRLRPYAFTLFDHYRITSKTFYMIIVYIMAVYTFICKRQFGN